MPFLVTVHGPDGRTFGPYALASSVPNSRAAMDELEAEALKRALADGLPETRAAICSCSWTFLPKHKDYEAKRPAA